MPNLSLLAQALPEPTASSLFDLILPIVGLLVGLFLIVWSFLWWMKKQREPDISAHELLTDFRTMQDTGDLSPEEFKKIKGVLNQRLRSEIDGPKPPPRTPTEE